VAFPALPAPASSYELVFHEKFCQLSLVACGAEAEPFLKENERVLRKPVFFGFYLFLDLLFYLFYLLFQLSKL